MYDLEYVFGREYADIGIPFQVLCPVTSMCQQSPIMLTSMGYELLYELIYPFLCPFINPTDIPEDA